MPGFCYYDTFTFLERFGEIYAEASLGDPEEPVLMIAEIEESSDPVYCQHRSGGTGIEVPEGTGYPLLAYSVSDPNNPKSIQELKYAKVTISYH